MMNTVDNRPSLMLSGGASTMPLSVDVAEFVLTQAAKRGLRVTVTNQEATLAATAAVSAAADAAYAVDFEDPLGSADWAGKAVADGEHFDVILGVREMAQVATAEIAAALGLPGNPPDAVRRVRTKDLCRAALAAAGFRQPAVGLCQDAAEAAAFLAATTGPWVVKPRDAMGSEGVSRVDGPADLDRALALLPEPGAFLVEQFVEGPEYSVEGVFLGGAPNVLAVTQKEKSEPPYFVELGHVLPAPLPAATTAEIAGEVEAALTAFGLRYGLFHVELWQSPDGIVLGEVHVRNGGGWIHRMLAYAIPGLEMFGLVCDDALGLPVPRPQAPSRGAATRFLTAPAGRVVDIEGWDRVCDHPAVIYAELTVAPGDFVQPLRSGEERLGAIVVGADTPLAAQALVRELAASVRFEIESEL